MLKNCYQCGDLKELKEFKKDKRLKSGYGGKCKKCLNKNNKIYRTTDTAKQKKNAWNKNNIEYVKRYEKSEKGKLSRKKTKIKRKKENQIYIKNYRIVNKDSINEQRRTRYNNDLQYKLMCNIRSRLFNFLQEKEIKKSKIKKTNNTLLSVGCSKEQLRNWINYNLELDNLNIFDCDIDHVRPLSSFNCKTYEDIIKTKCNHWTNMMPVLSEYNKSKNDTPPTKYELFKQELRVYNFKKQILI